MSRLTLRLFVLPSYEKVDLLVEGNLIRVLHEHEETPLVLLEEQNDEIASALRRYLAALEDPRVRAAAALAPHWEPRPTVKRDKSPRTKLNVSLSDLGF